MDGGAICHLSADFSMEIGQKIPDLMRGARNHWFSPSS
jgi:hypothetical protein